MCQLLFTLQHTPEAMQKNKRIEIKGIFFDEHDKHFNSIMQSVQQDSGIPPKKFIKKISPKLEELSETFDEITANFYIEHNKFTVKKFFKIHTSNQRTVIEENERSFHFFLFYINACTVLYEKAVVVVGRKKISSTVKLSLGIYGLILRRAQQIADLLINGYPDGAMMIWRSFYEYSITLLVIATEEDDALANGFFEHSVKNSQKKVTSYESNFRELKFKPLPKTTAKHLSQMKARVEGKYGAAFLESDYGWADGLFPGKQKASFRLLEQRVSMNRFRPYYLLCSEHLHSNFNGFKRYMEGNKIILPRIMRHESERVGLVDPMQFTLSILDEVTDYNLYVFSDPAEYNANKKFLRMIFESMQQTFDTKHRPDGK